MGHARQVGVCGLNAGAYRPGPHSGRPSVLLCGARALSVTPRVRSACPGGVERRFYSFLALWGRGGGGGATTKPHKSEAHFFSKKKQSRAEGGDAVRGRARPAGGELRRILGGPNPKDLKIGEVGHLW